MIGSTFTDYQEGRLALRKTCTHFALIQLGHLNHLHILLLLLHPLNQRLRQNQEVPPAVIDRERWESIVEPSVESVVKCTFTIRKAAFTAPPRMSAIRRRGRLYKTVDIPEDTSGTDGGWGETEHLGFTAVQPIVSKTLEDC